MKKIFLFVAILALSLYQTAFAASEWRTAYYDSDISASAGKTITVNISAVSGAKAVIHKILATSDLSTSVIQLQEADASGSTGNYTTILKLNCGNSTVEYGGNNPLFVGKLNYGYQLLLDSTTANSLMVLYSKE